MRTLATWDVVKFRETYKARGWTLQQVSVRSGIPYSAVRSYSAGTANPTPGRLLRLSGALEVPSKVLAPLSAQPTLHELRWHTGLTVAQFAERIGYSVSHTSAVMAGAVPITEPRRWTAIMNTGLEGLARAWEASRAEQGGA